MLMVVVVVVTGSCSCSCPWMTGARVISLARDFSTVQEHLCLIYGAVPIRPAPCMFLVSHRHFPCPALLQAHHNNQMMKPL